MRTNVVIDDKLMSRALKSCGCRTKRSAIEAGLRLALRWWLLGIPLVAFYFTLLFRLHRGPAVAARNGEGY